MSHRWLVGLLLLASGCGVSDYEARMVNAQKRLQQFEEESHLLTEPLSVPREKDKDGTEFPIANFFLRAPAGIKTSSPVAEPPSNSIKRYTYLANTGPVAWVQLAFGDQKDLKDFSDDLMRCFKAASDPTFGDRKVLVPGREKTFKETRFDDGQYVCSVNIWTGGKSPIAIIYGLRKGQEDAAAKAVQLSVESFAVDAEATRQRDLFDKGSPLLVPRHPPPQ